jgi:hypothetical protein
MKSLDEFKTIITEEKSEYGKFDMLVRAGLANRSQLARIHKVLDKMKDDRPVFTPAERAILQDIFNKMVDLVSNNKQIFQQTRRAVREETEEFEVEDLNESTMYSSDYKISPSGRKVRARRFKISDDPTSMDDEEKENVKEEVDLIEAKTTKSPVKGTPPFTLVLKRKAIRQYPNDTRVALYWSEKLKTYFSVPYQDDDGNISGVIQSESVIETLQKIHESKQTLSVNFDSGDTKTVDHHTATVLVNVYENLNEENKNRFVNMLQNSPEQFTKAADFAYKNKK